MSDDDDDDGLMANKHCWISVNQNSHSCNQPNNERCAGLMSAGR